MKCIANKNARLYINTKKVEFKNNGKIFAVIKKVLSSYSHEATDHKNKSVQKTMLLIRLILRI